MQQGYILMTNQKIISSLLITFNNSLAKCSSTRKGLTQVNKSVKFTQKTEKGGISLYEIMRVWLT